MIGYPNDMADLHDNPEWLNYHHLRHFWMIARHGSMTKAAEKMGLSQSTLSGQLAELEGWLGQPLFERRGRGLHLTEGGRMALEHAETIFATGQELLSRFRQSAQGGRRVLRVGAVGPLSKNLQFDFIAPLLRDPNVRVMVAAGDLDELTRRLQEHELDLVLSNIPLRGDQEVNVLSHLLGEVPVYLVGDYVPQGSRRKFPSFIEGVPLYLPSRQSHVRADFDLMLDNAGISPRIHVEVDDMALLRLLALSGEGLALVSKIVVERELEAKDLKFVRLVPGLSERFFALTVRRRLPNPWLAEIIEAFRKHLKELAR